MRLSALTLVLALVAAPALAGGYGEDYDLKPIKTMKVHETDNTLAGTLRYYFGIMIGGVDSFTDENGEEVEVFWDGFSGAFEIELSAGFDESEAAKLKFLRDAAVAVCPSLTAADMANANPQVVSAGKTQYVQALATCVELGEK